MRHPTLEYLLVAAVAAAVSFLLTPVARQLAIRFKAVARPRDRDVHAVATPRLGGVAVFAGFALALFFASRLPTLRDSFRSGPDLGFVVLSAAIICVVGIIDDRYELDSLTKLAGQVLATGVMVTRGGVQIAQFYDPFGNVGTFVLGRDLAIPVTILFTLLIINAMNFIDGLDGLAAGVCFIAATAFFVFSYHLGKEDLTSITSPATLLAAVLAGACLGFLPHNFFPARIFMGDSGSMVLGLTISAASVTATTTTDPQVYHGLSGSVATLLPLIVPAAVLALPFVDLVLAVLRRLSRGRSPFAPDKQHLHHRMLELGHTHRRAVLLLYFWSALISAVGVGLSFQGSGSTLITLVCVLGAIGVLLLAVPRLRRIGRRRGGGPRSGAGPGALSAPETGPDSVTAQPSR